MFDELDARQQRTGITNQAAAWLENQFQTACTDPVFERLGHTRPNQATFSSWLNNADTAAQVPSVPTQCLRLPVGRPRSRYARRLQ